MRQVFLKMFIYKIIQQGILPYIYINNNLIIFSLWCLQYFKYYLPRRVVTPLTTKPLSVKSNNAQCCSVTSTGVLRSKHNRISAPGPSFLTTLISPPILLTCHPTEVIRSKEITFQTHNLL